MTDVVDLQLQQDDELLHIVRDHLKAHIDVYPFALQMLNTVLRAAQESPSCGGSEPDLLMELHSGTQHVVAASDPHSAGFFDKSIYESPR